MNEQRFFVENGYFVHRFDAMNGIVELRNACIEACKLKFPKQFKSLAKYHEMDVEDKIHSEFQYELYNLINQKQYHRIFAQKNLAFFTSMLGPDIDIQTNMYLRISRPNKVQDNIGMHRDTDYGNSAFEVSFSLPLIDQEKGSGLNVVPASHLLKEHVVEKIQREDVQKGDDKNLMGFLYAPKIPVTLNEEDVKSISIKYGECLGFSLGLIHGQIKNNSSMTRWSVDFRMKNSFHPLNINLKENYYSHLNSGALSQIATDYYSINRSEIEELKYKKIL